jgi:glycine betaine/choline ABC-type transport system substrate-binding protein
VAQRAGPDLRATIERLQRELTDEVMQELNARVDLDDKDPKAVANEYLRETELLPG